MLAARSGQASRCYSSARSSRLNRSPVEFKQLPRQVTVQATKGSQSGQREPWDFFRFVRTVIFFNDPPQPQKVLEALLSQPAKLLSGLMPAETASERSSIVTVLKGNEARSAPGKRDVVLVAGATGGVGKRVVGVLLSQGQRVRALVRDVEKARQLLADLPVAAGGLLELVCADITQRATLLPEMFEGVRAAVCCTAVKVAPKEGDVDRKKYFQGIKFYDPEIVGDTPETVELVGVRNLLAALRPALGVEAGVAVLAAADPEALRQQWGALDDVVMGGVSESSLRLLRGGGENGGDVALFSGVVRVENSGGFASVRSRPFTPLLDLSPYEGLALRLKGDGQRYKLIVREGSEWDGLGYTKSFDTVAGEWQTVQLPFSEFIPVFRARTVRDAAPLDLSRIGSVQLMLSKFEYDGQLNPSFRPGPFQLPVASIRTYLAEPVTPRFVHVSSAGVTRPDRPGINVDVEPPAVKLNAALGGILTYKLAGEDEVRRSGVPFAVVRPTALTEEPRGMPLEFDQGDVIKGKVGREDVAELCVALLSSPAGRDVTFEVKSSVPFSQPWQWPQGAAPPPRNWPQVLQGAGLRPGVTGRTVDGVYTGKEPEPGWEHGAAPLTVHPAAVGAASRA